MDFGFSPEHEAFRREVREFMEREITEGVIEEEESGSGFGPPTWDLLRKLGARGWLCPHWPKEYGGLGASSMHRLIVLEEMGAHGGPVRTEGTSVAGPIILRFGSEEQKRDYLPRLARGEIDFCLGYSEPEAGSDLANLKIRAVEDGDYYVINGQKQWSSGAHFAQYHWLAARTDPNAPKHRGVSLFIVDLESPGISITPVWLLSGRRVNEAFYDDVRVPKGNLVGEKNKGFYQITAGMAWQRIFTVGDLERILEQMVEYARETRHNGHPLSQDLLIRHKLAERAIEVQVGRLLSYRVAGMHDKGIAPEYEASMLKMFTSELKQRLLETVMEIMGLYGQLEPGSKWARLQGRIERIYLDSRIITIAGGTSEIQRNTVATRGLGLPR